MTWRRRQSRDDDLDRELRSHLEAEADEQQESGLPAEEARYGARRAFGNISLAKEDTRRAWAWTRWEILVQDFRYALRTLRKSPGFVATAILTLALGIGASTAVFTVVDSVVLKPLTYRDSSKLVVAWERVRFLSSEPIGPNPRHVDVWQKRATVFTGLTFFRHMAMGLTIGTDHPRLIGAVVSLPNLFDVLQVQPFLGRTFMPEDGAKGHDRVAILTYPFWQGQFHGERAVIGRTIRIDNIPREMIGVLPPSFHFPNGNALRSTRSKQPVSSAPQPIVFLPVALDITQFAWNGNYGNWITLGRLKPGVTAREAEAQLTAIQGQIVREMPADNRTRQSGDLLASVQPMREAVVGDSRTGLWLLMAAVTALMLIACVNLANAQLSRAMARCHEAAVRSALGAAKWRLIWHTLTENLILAAVGGVAGVLLASFGLNLFRRYSSVDLPRLSEIHLNLTVLAFALLVTISASLLSGMLPALRLVSIDAGASLQQNNSRALGSRQNSRLRTWLIGLQVFGCTVLLLVTGLFSKSLLYLLHQDIGLQTEHVAIAEVRLTPENYGADQSRVALDDAVLQNLRAIPGIQIASLVSAMPLEGGSWIEQLQRVDRPEQQTPLINFRWVSPGYFETTGQKLIVGRFLEEHDRNLKGAVLSEGLAKAVWETENPIGSQVRIEGRAFTVVGVVADSRNTSLKSPPVPMAYVHYNDRPPYATFFLVRSARSADTLVSSMRQAIWKYAPDVTIARVKTLDSQVIDSVATERFQTSVLLAFGIAALLLAMLGIYGVLSYSVVTRKQEIGVRMALGAARRSIYALTFSEASVPIGVGLTGGLAASLFAARLIQKLLYGIRVVDPTVIVIVVGLFLVSASAAAFLPARRAASVDPMDALRSE